jgi:lipoic acid synthetase
MMGKRADAQKTKETSGQIKSRISNLLTKPICITTQCPNQCKCITHGTATFSIMGNICTRSCGFCIFPQGKPLPLDSEEPVKIALSAKQLNLSYVAITSVNRDDLPDGGASHFAKVVTAIHESLPDAIVEINIHDFLGNTDSLKIIAGSSPEVINHHIDIVPRLYSKLNAEADYSRSLHILELVNSCNPDIVTKSGLMLGLGENDYEVIKVMKDVVDTGCKAITMGQYLPPSTQNFKMDRCITSHEFDEYHSLSLQMGYSSARSGPFVRSSFDAYEMYKEIAQ